MATTPPDAADRSERDAVTHSPPGEQTTFPVGVVLLAVLLLLISLYLTINWGRRLAYDYRAVADAARAGPQVTVVFPPDYFIVISRDALMMLSALLGAIGLFALHRLGWWMAMFHSYLRITCLCVFPLFNLLVTPRDAYSTLRPGSTIVQAVFSGVVFSLVILYLHKKNVVNCLRVAAARRPLTDVALLSIAMLLALLLDLWTEIVQQGM